MALPIGTRLGAYEILAPIGAGGMGEVYRARDSRLDRQVAIKVLPAEFTADQDRVRRFVQEAKAASALNTPPQKSNAHAFKMTAVFWIETVREKLVVPRCKANGLPITVQAAPRSGSSLRPTFTLTPPHDITNDTTTLTVRYTQIQYSQSVFLNFGPLTWPHVSVATLIPAAPIPVPASVWT